MYNCVEYGWKIHDWAYRPSFKIKNIHKSLNLQKFVGCHTRTRHTHTRSHTRAHSSKFSVFFYSEILLLEVKMEWIANG